MARKAAAPDPVRKPRVRRASASDFDIPAPPAPPAEEPLYMAAAPPPPSRGPSLFGRHPLLAGVAIACVMGAGAGLWARPADTERRGVKPVAAKPAPAPVKPAGELKVFVGEAPPAPLGEPMEVMRADAPAYYTPTPLAAQPLETPPPEPAPEPALRAPAPRPDGLTRVAVVEPEPAPVAKPVVKAKPVAKAEKKPEKAVLKAEAKKPEPKKTLAKAKTVKKPEPKLTKTKGKAVKTLEPKLTKARTDVAPQSVKRELELLKAEVARLKKPKPDKSLRLAEAKAKAKPIPAKAKTEPKSNLDFGKLLASLKTKEPAKVEKAVLKTAAPPPPKPAARPEPAPEPPKPAVVARAVERDPCAGGDPGETLVCQNPSLQVADRALNRAYRAAEDAGVEPWRLRQQQRRWLAARAAAARDNPWAVRDVYEARIAELDDLRRAARSGY